MNWEFLAVTWGEHDTPEHIAGSTTVPYINLQVERLESVPDISGLIGPDDYSKVFKPSFDIQI